ncbi:hypothetical protein FA13DRAFT_1889261 [Coprinellus micaceus]|uniref:Uncharacterized protein n=1 Tax=Coprinellus micaceus TaxID=71717 RepID=A0A4Y7SYD6_COPMI|nr:hypothetical protein FA13DRAFT_1889261 [Coprinellus micaceus]
MRWSLIISISATLLGLFAFSAYGLVIPVDADDGLVLRAVTKKARKPSAPRAKNPLTQGSAKDRKESYKHRHSYAVQKDKNGMKKWQADHIHEKQMVHGHLKENGLKFGDLPKNTQKRVHGIVNGPSNLARIPGSVNGSKGNKVRNAMKGKRIKDRNDRDGYMKESYPQSKKVAQSLDSAYKQGKVKLPKSTAVQFLDKTMKTGGIKKK